MGPDGQQPGFVLWTASQRRALLVLLLALGVALAARRFRDRADLPDPPPPEGPRSAELADRIDPNTADWQTLAAIPTLGEKRAMDIVRYRQRCLEKDPKAVAFRSLDDLYAVRGIGLAMLGNLRPYLTFPAAPAAPPATRP